MAQKFLVLGTKPDGSSEMLASPSVEFSRQKDVLHKNAENEKFSEVQMFMLQPHTRVFRPIAAAEHKKALAAQAKADAEAEAKAKKK